MTTPLKLDPARAVVLIVDVQERLCTAMPQDELARLVKYAKALIGTARELGIPVLATEQYPKGLGPTLPALREILPSPPLEKMHFACAPDPGCAAARAATRRRQVVIAGMETHVCVYPTARDRVRSGHDVHVCADAVTSRYAVHRQVGLELCRQAGAVVTTAESAIFDLLERCGTPQFKKASALVK